MAESLQMFKETKTGKPELRMQTPQSVPEVESRSSLTRIENYML